MFYFLIIVIVYKKEIICLNHQTFQNYLNEKKDFQIESKYIFTNVFISRIKFRIRVGNHLWRRVKIKQKVIIKKLIRVSGFFSCTSFLVNNKRNFYKNLISIRLFFSISDKNFKF